MNGNWTNTSANGDAFVESSGAVNLVGGGNQTITNINDETFYDLGVNKGGGTVTLSAGSDVSVTNQLTLTAGVIFPTGGEMVIVPATGAASSTANSYVSGKVRKVGNTAFVFPIGKGGRYARIGISGPSVSSTFDGEYYTSAYANTSAVGTLNNISQKEYWDLDRTGTGNCSVTLYWESGTYSAIQDLSGGDLVVAHWNSGLTKWEDMGGSITGTVGAGTVTSGIMTSFSPVAPASGGGANTLPIELLSFSAKLEGKQVAVNWETASEINNDFFTAERSVDNVSFKQIAYVPGSGTSFSSLNYSIIDEHPESGVSYYRLKQTDFDGTFEYSKILVIENESEPLGDFSLYPNPSTDGKFVLDFKDQAKEDVLLILYSAMGEIVYSKTIVVEDGDSLVAVQLSESIVPGIYLIVGTSNNELFRKKLVVR